MAGVAGGRVTRALGALAAMLLAGGCDCHGVGLEGDGSSPGDTEDDVSPPEDSADMATPDAHDAADLSDVSEAEVDAAPPCWDEDDDGHPSAECGGDDCDDSDPNVYPGAPDECGDGIDTNCDGIDPHPGLLGDSQVLLEYAAGGVVLHSWLLWTGEDYVFVWQLWHSAGMFVRRVSRIGDPADDYARMGDYRLGFQMVWSGTRFGTVWVEEAPEPPDLYFQPLDSTTAPIADPVRFVDARTVVGEDAYVGSPTLVLSVDGDFVVAWTDDRAGVDNVYLTRLDRDGGRLLDDVRLSIAGGEISSLGLVQAGSELGAAWTVGGTSPPGSDAAIVLRRVTGDGAIIDPLQLVSDSAMGAAADRLVWTGADYGVVWQEGHFPDFGPVVFSRLETSSGTVERTDLEGVPPFAHGSATWVEGRLVVPHADERDDGTALVVRSFDAVGRPLGTPLVVPAAGRPFGAMLAWSGTEIGIAWGERVSDDEGERIRVLFNRIGLCE